MKNITSKTFKLFIAIAFLIESTTAFAFYSDVLETHPQYNSIKSLYDSGLLPEYEDNLFRPDEKLKTSEIYELIFAYAQVDLSSEMTLPYKDMNKNTTISKYSALSKIFDILGIGTTYFFDKDSFPFIDIETNSFKAPLAAKAAELNIIETEKPNYFKGSKRILRAEAADYLYKIHNSVPFISIEITNLGESQNQTNSESITDLALLIDIWETLQTDYLYKDELNKQDLLYSAIKGLLTEIDDIYTVFQEPGEAEQFINMLSTDEYEGVGMYIELIDNNIVIVSPLKDSPAEKAGLKPNDIIIGIDGESVVGESLTTVVNKIKGPKGTQVKIKILRENEEIEFEVTRDSIINSSVQYEILETDNNKKIGYIEISFFGNSTYQEFLDTETAVIDEEIQGLILDLRNNPGGYLDTAINMADEFIEESKIIVSLQFADKENQDYKATAGANLSSYKTIILINEGSASASEVLAGALQDYDLATLIGTTSFGKGTVQQLDEYTDGSIFKYTVSKWLTPNGTNINETGLTPDIIVEDNETNDEQLEKALKQF